MLRIEVIPHLGRWRNQSPPVKLHYYDRTLGETEENYFILGDRDQFGSIFEFAAAALMAIAERLELSLEEFSELEVHSCEPESWMHRYNSIIQPGSMLCFPSIEILGFEPPSKIHRKLFLAPHLSSTEECYVGQSQRCYVFLYWATTG